MRLRSIMSKKKETGGILIGRYSLDLSLAIIARATDPPRDSRAGATWFERGTADIEKLLNDAWTKNFHYLGEWHSHPGGSPIASSNDEEQMRRIASDELVRCSTPVLLIVGGVKNALTIAAFAHKNGSFLHLVKKQVDHRS